MMKNSYITAMKKSVILVVLTTLLVACGPSQDDFETLRNENEMLKAQIQSLTHELDAYKYSPEKLLAEAQIASKNENKDKLYLILANLQEYHPQAPECVKVQKMIDDIIAKEQVTKEAERKKLEEEKQERLSVVKSLRKKYDDVQDITWYSNPYFIHYNNTNLVSLYIGESATKVWLRLKISIYNCDDDDWIFFNRAYLWYDGNLQELEYESLSDHHWDNTADCKWEWCDLKVRESDLLFLQKLIYGKTVKVQLRGREKVETRTLSDEEISAIKVMITAYKVLQEEKRRSTY